MLERSVSLSLVIQMSAPGPSDSRADAGNRELRAQRFAEVIRYAQKVCGKGSGERASQRELADRIDVAGTMVTRYLSGSVDWSNCKTHTAALIAKAAELHVGSIYVWIDQGREAALQHEAQLRGRPVAFQPLDLARELTAMLEAEPHEAGELGVSIQLLKARLEDAERESPRLFGTLVAKLGAESAVAKVQFGEPLSSQELEIISVLLGEPMDPARYSLKTETKTAPLPA